MLEHILLSDDWREIIVGAVNTLFIVVLTIVLVGAFNLVWAVFKLGLVYFLPGLVIDTSVKTGKKVTVGLCILMLIGLYYLFNSP